MLEQVIPHSRPSLGEAEADAAAAVLRSGYLAQGPKVAAFEAALHRLLDRDGFPGAEEAWRTSLSLPCSPALTDGEVSRVAEAARAILGGGGR